MKRHVQSIGVRKWAGADLIELQSQSLEAIDRIFRQYGPCVVQGCEVTARGETYDIAPGLVALSGGNHDGQTAFMVVPFDGTQGVALPVYLTLSYTSRSRLYVDGAVKPIAYDYKATASTVKPSNETPFLEITQAGNYRFVDVLQDAHHRLITDAERTNWNARETTTGAQTKADKALSDAKIHANTGDATTLASAKLDATTKADKALTDAKTYTNTRETAIQTAVDNKDATTLRSAKTYADAVVAALVDSSPAALNTLNKLAAALGDDPNFATTVMTEIGKRVTTTAFNTAIGGKLDKKGGVANGNFKVSMENVTDNSDYILFGKDSIGTAINNSKNGATTSQLRLNNDGRITHYNGFTLKIADIWTSETFNPNSKMNAITKTDGDCNDWSQNGVYTVAQDIQAMKILNSPFNNAFSILTIQNADCTQIATNYKDCTMRIRTKHWSTGWGTWNTFWNSVNFDPTTKADVNHTPPPTTVIRFFVEP